MEENKSKTIDTDALAKRLGVSKDKARSMANENNIRRLSGIKKDLWLVEDVDEYMRVLKPLAYTLPKEAVVETPLVPTEAQIKIQEAKDEIELIKKQRELAEEKSKQRDFELAEEIKEAERNHLRVLPDVLKAREEGVKAREEGVEAKKRELAIIEQGLVQREQKVIQDNNQIKNQVKEADSYVVKIKVEADEYANEVKAEADTLVTEKEAHLKELEDSIEQKQYDLSIPTAQIKSEVEEITKRCEAQVERYQDVLDRASVCGACFYNQRGNTYTQAGNDLMAPEEGSISGSPLGVTTVLGIEIKGFDRIREEIKKWIP